MSEEEQIILPDGFTRAVYLESSGTQYIDTEYVPTANSGLWIDAQQITHSNGHPMGSGWDGNNPADGFTAPRWLKSTGNSCGFGWKTWVVWGYNGNGKRFKSTLNYFNSKKAEMIIDGETVNSSTLGELGFMPTKSIYLFSTNYANSSTINWNGRIYRAKISEGAEIVRDFIPCADSDGVPCMYDLITQTAYYNVGSGTFLYANYVEEEEENTHVYLPNGYTKLDYLYSEGNQYIDTGYVPTNETGLYIDCQSYNTKLSSPFGCRNNTSTDSRFYAHIASGEIALGWITYESISTTSSFRTHRYESKLNFKNSRIAKITIGDEYEHEKVLGDLSFTPTSSIYIFDYSINGNVASASTITEDGHCGKIFRAKISQGDTVVRDYVPALDPDGIPCMFEVFTGEAYYNQGSGKFLTPLDFQRTKIPKNFKRVPWLESSGTQYINTDYIPNNETGLWIRCRKNNPTTTTGLQIPFGMSGGTYIYPLSINNTYLQYSWGGYVTTNGSYYYVDDGEPYDSSLNFFNSKIVSFTSLENNYSKTDTKTLAAMNKPLYLFSYNNNGTVGYSLIGKVYRAKISQLDTVVRDYLPCVDEAGIPCMYDLVTQTAYYNAGTNKFSFLGRFAASYTDYCTLGIISDRLGVGDMDENLIKQIPNNYTRLKFLKGNGNEYIDTEYYATDKTGLYCDNWTTDVSNSQFAMGYYSTTNLITNSNIHFYCPRANLYCGHGYSAENDKTSALSAYKGKRIVSYLNFRNSKVATYDFIDVDAKFEYALGTYSISMKYPIYMFSSQNNGAANYKFRGKIYRAKITEGSMLVRDYVPCLDGDGIPCMYDMIQGKTYYNKGTGAFSYE